MALTLPRGYTAYPQPVKSWYSVHSRAQVVAMGERAVGAGRGACLSPLHGSGGMVGTVGTRVSQQNKARLDIAPSPKVNVRIGRLF